ncbi:MAG TPA: hypothetical protein VF121_00330 [Thermoanaerobaculia bacterium]|nr:hypothetical protein [Thermoanaerobaculia bacterium]
MLQALRDRAAIPQIPARVLLSAGTLASFAWLLSQDLIDPLVVFALQLYLAF